MTTAAHAVARLEALEGMRVTVPLTVVGPTLGNINEPARRVGTANGVFHGVGRPALRVPSAKPGSTQRSPPTCAAGVGCAIPAFDTNPERLRIVSSLARGSRCST